MSTLLSKILPALRSLYAFVKSPRAQRVMWVVAVMIFAGGLFLSIQARPAMMQEFDIRLFLVLVVGFCPAIIAINTAMLRSTAAIASAQFTWAEALRLSVLSSALNHLPLPAGVMLRVGAMRERGSNFVIASAVNIAAALLWLGVSMIYAGAWALGPAQFLGAIFLIGGTAALLAGGGMTWRVRRNIGDVLNLSSLLTLQQVVYSAALWVAFRAVGSEVAFGEASVVSGAGVFGSAASFLPAGLGAREAAGAFLGSQIALDPYSAFATTAFVHIAMVAALCMSATFFSLQKEPEGLAQQPVDNLR